MRRRRDVPAPRRLLPARRRRARSGRRLALAVAAIVAVAAIAGCGSSASSPAAQRSAVAASVLAYLHGIVDGDGAQVCSHLTPALRARDTAELNRQLGASNALVGSRSLSCAAAFHKVGSLIPASDRTRSFSVTRVTLDGSSATAMLKGADAPAHLVRQGGHWLVAGYTQAGS